MTRRSTPKNNIFLKFFTISRGAPLPSQRLKCKNRLRCTSEALNYQQQELL